MAADQPRVVGGGCREGREEGGERERWGGRGEGERDDSYRCWSRQMFSLFNMISVGLHLASVSTSCSTFLLQGLLEHLVETLTRHSK